MKFWFMRDNHTFIKFPDKATELVDFLNAKQLEEPGFYHYGLLGARDSKDETVASIQFNKSSHTEFVVEVMTFYANVPEEVKNEITLLREELAECKKKLLTQDQIVRDFIKRYLHD
jgi:hypothetical protein